MLVTLNLDGCDIGGRGANYVGDMLRDTMSLRSLSLARNSIGDEGCAAIGEDVMPAR